MYYPRDVVHSYLRTDTPTKDLFPHIWCPGCGHGIITGSLIRSIHKLGYKKDNVVIVSGIGCSSRAPTYLDFNTLHTSHGRALSFATGIKFAKPDLKVIVVTGDGDAMAIGGNHFIHAIRRNIDITAIVYNNNIYGMTGGQYSPTTPQGAKSSTSIYGHVGHPFDICRVAKGCGCTFVARASSYHVLQTDQYIEKALQKKGFSVVEVLSQCHTGYGRRNKIKSNLDMYKWQRDTLIPVEQYDKLTPEEKAMKKKIPMGIFVNKEKEEYCDMYDRVIESLKEEKHEK